MGKAHGLDAGTARQDDDVALSLMRGERALFVEGDLQTGRRLFEAAYGEAERRGDGSGMARAALGMGGLWVHEHRMAADAARVRMRQHRALTSVDPRSSLGLRLRIRLAGEEDYRTGGHAGILAMVAEARRAGDAAALTEALSLAHHCLLGPEHGALRMELAQELIGEASRTDRRSDLLMGLLWRTVDLFLSADPHAERCLGELRGLLAQGDHLAVGFVSDAIQVMRSIRDGGFEQAESLAAACAERGAAAGDADATVWYGGQLVAIRWYQGRIAELAPMVAELVASPTLSVMDNSYSAILAVAAATAGDLRPAAGALARVRGRDLADLPRSSTWLVSMYGVVEAAHLLRDTGSAERAYALLSPFARLPVIASLGVACLGSVQHSLGVAALTMGNADRAVEHLRAALHDDLALGHWPATVLARSRLGQALALRDGPRDPGARCELDLAAREAAALGMVLPAGLRPDPGGPVTGGGAGERAPGVVARRRGRQWRVELGHRAALVGHSVGMGHLATLLANPGREIPATELAAGSALRGTAVGGAAESAQPILDDLAVHDYRRRLAQLRAEIDELDSANEPERAAAARAERDWLVAELAAATGMGGRSRRFAGNEERARIAVGKAIRRALNRIDQADPVIGGELRATVQTGVRCCYRPG
ncbi:hypothetical protein [Planobispora takensis]|uniref:Uncharacterized protein n=1 Tax=Planobispora takensis TaxID=1367882 RepID=A0A8J3T5J9_9ACTN|nr:hypothetical protein [Planobispora takensis]GII01399.1 hypothetical protein Pta02_34070 [Planobispora takensis]